MIELNVRGDMKALAKQLDNFAREQVRFATSQAINSVAAEVAAAERENMKAKLDAPTPFTLAGVAVKRSTKQSLTATVYVKPIQALYLTPSEEQSTQVLPGSSRAMLRPANPTQKNRYGNLPRGRVAALSQRSDVFVGVVQTADGAIDGVWQRPVALRKARGTRSEIRGTKTRGAKLRGANRTGRLKLLVRFADPVRVRTKLEWGKSAAQIVKRSMPIALDREMAKAIATAKAK
ncbi:hypothetical protein [Paraburkholderia sp. JPY419]|uniref:hypothetical protein n=1 Tax=Paraburkholderia sp. JPY419 TaxID=667660 RepID=UPI003D232DFE